MRFQNHLPVYNGRLAKPQECVKAVNIYTSMARTNLWGQTSGTNICKHEIHVIMDKPELLASMV